MVRTDTWAIFSHPGPSVSPSPHSAGAATSQKSVSRSSHSLLLPQSAIPAEALAPPFHEPLQAQEHGGPFSTGIGSLPLNPSTFLCRSLTARGNPVTRLDSLLTETLHLRGLATLPRQIQSHHHRPTPSRRTLPTALHLALSYEFCLHLFYLAPNGPFPSIIDAPFLSFMPQRV